MLVQTTWEEALEYVAEQYRARSQAGSWRPDAFGGLISGRCTNEELYLFQKFLRRRDRHEPYRQQRALWPCQRPAGHATRAGDASVDRHLRRHPGRRCPAPRRHEHYRDESHHRPQSERSGEETAGDADHHRIDSSPAIDTISNIANLSHHHFRVPTGSIRPCDHRSGESRRRRPIYIDPDRSQQRSSGVCLGAVRSARQQLSWQDLEAATGTEPRRFVETATAIAQGAPGRDRGRTGLVAECRRLRRLSDPARSAPSHGEVG